MGIAVSSIDRAANGLARHRFVRAMGASWMVLFILALLALGASSVAAEGDAQSSLAMRIAVAPIAMVLVLAPVLIAAAVGGALWDSVHRRVIAAAALVAYVTALVFLPFAVLGGVGQEFGFIERDAEGSTAHNAPWQNWAMIALIVLCIIAAIEGLRWAWWQLRISKEEFIAARGWKPQGMRLFSGLRRMLGLPAFISNFGHGRMTLTLLYFLVAALNVGIVALFVTPFLIFGAEQGQGDFATVLWVAAGMGVLLALNIIGVGRLFDRLADRRATALYQDVREWDERAPIVFLRTFDHDARKLPAPVRHPMLRLPAGVSAPQTLDEVLLEHASPYGPVIAIGDPRDPTPPLGAARIFVPGEGLGWQDVVMALVGASRAVVMSPNTTEGVKWELDLLSKSEGRVRAIYIANPELPGETTLDLFRAIIPGGQELAASGKQMPIAAYEDPQHGWRVLTTSLTPRVQTYTIALNIALQRMFGLGGAALKRAKRPAVAKRARTGSGAPVAA